MGDGFVQHQAVACSVGLYLVSPPQHAFKTAGNVFRTCRVLNLLQRRPENGLGLCMNIIFDFNYIVAWSSDMLYPVFGQHWSARLLEHSTCLSFILL
jgi:hypothetical protein